MSTENAKQSGPVQLSIQVKLADAFSPLHLEVINESGMHSVPPGSESHFKVTLVSEQFTDQELVQRHRAVNSVLTEELSGIHALSLHIMTPDEWFDKGGVVEQSPQCLGGSKIKTDSA